MITLKNICNRVYIDRECTGFSINIIDEDYKESPVEFRFRRLQQGAVGFIWSVDYFLQGVGNMFTFETPKKTMPLETIAEMGINAVKSILIDEVSYKSSLNATLGELIKP